MSNSTLPKEIPYLLVARDQWGASPPRYKGKAPRFPIPYVVITYITETDRCESGEDCARIMRQLQKRHMEEDDFIDIGFNYVIGGDGRVYEGRGWHVLSESKTFPETIGKRFDIAYIGNYNKDEISDEMFEATMYILNEGSDHRFLEEEWATLEYPGGDEDEQCHVEQQEEND